MSTAFQILATLLAAEFVAAMAPGAVGLLVARAADRRLALATALGAWPVAVVWAALGLASIDVLFDRLPEFAPAIRLVCALHLARLGFLTVRRCSADAVGPSEPAPTSFALALRLGADAALRGPKAILWYAALFAVTGAATLGPAGRLFAVVVVPTASFVWNALVAAAVARPRFAEVAVAPVRRRPRRLSATRYPSA